MSGPLELCPTCGEPVEDDAFGDPWCYTCERYVDQMPPQRLIRNSARCLKCGDEIVSTHRHDFRWCGCGSIFVDGGTDYIRRGQKPGAVWEDTSVWEDE